MIQSFEGKAPRIDPEAFVHEDASLIGDVVVGPRASIWPGAVLRGDMGLIEVGEESSIQDGSVCHMTEHLSVCRVGKRVTVGHRVVVHGCTIEDECLIGMGAVLLDNCVIGRGSVVGAGALVTYNTVIPPGSLVLGSPGRVVRQVSDRDRQLVETGWRTYVDYARRYLAERAARAG